MSHIKTILIIILSFMSTQMWAYDTEPDENGFYDSKYSRPTHFPNFKHPTQYPNNMSYFTHARFGRNGARLENYEVAVYDDRDSLVATGRAIKKDNWMCSVTIIGTEGIQYHFKVIYGDFDNPTIVDVPETCWFKTNDIVGNPKNDGYFWLTLPMEPQLQCWTSSMTGDADAVFSFDDISSPSSAATIASSKRLALVGDWGKKDVSGMFAGCKDLRYVDIDETPIGIESAFADSNPNCLYFFHDGITAAPEGMNNVVAKKDALTDIVLRGGDKTKHNPFFCPVDINLGEHKAIYTRPSWTWADGKSGWNTLCLPFEAELQADEQAITPYTTTALTKPIFLQHTLGYWLATITYSDTESIDPELITDATTLKANEPYLISFPGKRFYQEISSTIYSVSLEGRQLSFVSTGDIIPATPTTQLGVTVKDVYAEEYPFVGTYEPQLRQPMYVIKNKAGDDGLTAFVYSDTANLLPFQAYLQTSASPSTPNLSIRLLVDDSFMDGSTGIEAPKREAGTSPSYGIDGRPTQAGNRNGITIKNHKKYIQR